MGEYAELMLDGAFCEACGEFMGDSLGYLQRCAGCHHEITVAEVEKERSNQDGSFKNNRS